MIWRCGTYVFDLSQRVLVMGIVNVTSDSFSDGGRFLDPDAAAAHALRLADEGADIVDVGGESTRPGADPVSAEEEWRRLEPVLDRIGGRTGLCLSVDTSKSLVAERAIQHGASLINDVSALRGDPRMVEVAARRRVGVLLMHMQGTPEDMQREPRYQDVVSEVRAFLAERLAFARSHGVADERLAIDPGIGFGKTLDHNLELIARLEELAPLGRPLVLGASRKSFIGKVLDLPVEERLEGSLAAAVAGVLAGAQVIRAHDARATQRAVRLALALRQARTARLGEPA